MKYKEELDKPKYDLTSYQVELILKLIEKARREGIKEGISLQEKMQ